MTDFDYPPTRTWTLGAALEAAEDRLAELTADDGDDGDDAAPADVRSWQNYRDGLSWAVHGDGRDDGFAGWGEDAEVELEAFTATTRARILDTARRSTMGQLGREQTRTWLVAGSVTRAPWLDGGDLQARVETTAALPPALVDWLDNELEALNDLGN